MGYGSLQSTCTCTLCIRHFYNCVLLSINTEFDDQEHSPLSDIVSMESVTSSHSQLSSQVGELGVLDLLTELLDKYSEVLEIQVHGFSAIEHICVLPEVKVQALMNIVHVHVHVCTDCTVIYMYSDSHIICSVCVQ